MLEKTIEKYFTNILEICLQLQRLLLIPNIEMTTMDLVVCPTSQYEKEFRYFAKL